MKYRNRVTSTLSYCLNFLINNEISVIHGICEKQRYSTIIHIIQVIFSATCQQKLPRSLALSILKALARSINPNDEL